jgi:hypothetical protein
MNARTSSRFSDTGGNVSRSRIERTPDRLYFTDSDEANQLIAKDLAESALVRNKVEPNEEGAK